MNIIEFVKNNRFVYSAYSFLGGAFINLIKLFVKTDDKLILFVSYGGRHYNDSPKCIYEKMLDDERFKDYRLIWAFRNPSDKPVKEAIKIDTLKYYITALKARCWVTNVVIERGLNFTGKHTYYFHTTHTTLPKLSGNDEQKIVFGSRFRYKYDCSCAQSEEEKRLQQNMFDLKPEQILVCGYPKNDALVHATSEDRDSILKELGIEPSKKTIMYAPTFREYNTDKENLPISFFRWKGILGDEFVVLFRAHPIIAQRMVSSIPGFLYDVSSYPDNMKLMIASDYFISDYSGIFFEYAVLNRPMYCYAYDYDEYIKTRQLYMDIRKQLPSGNETEIMNMIKNSDHSFEMGKVNKFKSIYVAEYGNATSKAVDNIYNSII